MVNYLDDETYKEYKNKLVIFFIIEKCNPEIAKKKILEFDCSPYIPRNSALLNYLVEITTEHGNNELIDYLNYKYPGYIRYYLERDSLFIQNTQNILWLVDNYGLSFFDYKNHIQKNYYYNKDKNLLFELIKRINFNQYSNVNEIIEFIWDIRDIDILKIIFEKTDKIKKFEDVHLKIMEIALRNNNKKFIKYYTNNYHRKKDYDRNFIEKCIIHNFEYIDLPLNEEYYYCHYKDKSIKRISPTLNLIYNKLIEVFPKEEIIDYICSIQKEYLQGTLLNSIIRFKSIKILDDIYKVKGAQNFKWLLKSVLEDLFKYGQYIVLNYLKNLKEGSFLKEVINSNYRDLSNFINCALINSDDRMVKYLLPFNDNDKTLYLDYEYAGNNSSTKTKIRKTKDYY